MHNTRNPDGEGIAAADATRPSTVASPTSPSATLTLTYGQAARLAGLSARTVWSAANGGGLRSIRVGRRRLILRSDLLAWLESLASDSSRR